MTERSTGVAKKMMTWAEWVRDQRTRPDATTAQFTAEGVSPENALILTMLGRILSELQEMNERRGDDFPREPWQE